MKRLALACVVLLSGCASNPYGEFYEGSPHGSEAPGYIAPTAPVSVYTTDNQMREVRRLAAKGYVKIGASRFDAAEVSESREQAVAQAEAIGAELVLYTPPTSEAVKGAPSIDALVAPGARLPVPAGLTSSSQDRQVVASYWSKRKTKLGMYGYFLDAKTRQLTGAQPGMVIETVVEGSGAHAQDIRSGDMILLWNGAPLVSREQYQQLMRDLKDGTVTLTLVRDGKQLVKQVPVSPL